LIKEFLYFFQSPIATREMMWWNFIFMGAMLLLNIF
jgi:hypothetical protein